VGGVVAVGVTLPVAVAVGVDVAVFVAVGVILPVGVAVDVAVKVDVNVGVKVPVVSARLRKMTMVCEAAVPSTILTLAVPALRFLLSNRSAGIV
jgi:hypothetical protein